MGFQVSLILVHSSLVLGSQHHSPDSRDGVGDMKSPYMQNSNMLKDIKILSSHIAIAKGLWEMVIQLFRGKHNLDIFKYITLKTQVYSLLKLSVLQIQLRVTSNVDGIKLGVRESS